MYLFLKLNLAGKLAVVSLLILATFGCQNQTTSNSANSNIPANNANGANQTNAQGDVPAPQNVKFESAEKAEIVGTFYESPKANSPAVLLLHQWQSDRKSYAEFAKRLQKDGIGVLAIDGRGFGESVKTTDGKTIEPSRTDETVKGMIVDVANAFGFLVKQKNVDPNRIGIVGASYGSSLAIIYGSQDKAVKAVALLSPGLNYFGNMPTELPVKNYGMRPLLMVAAEDDKESADAVRKLKEIGGNEKYETKIYEKGGHGTALFEVGLADLLEKFLEENL